MLPYDSIAKFIQSGKCFLRQDASIVFLCGRDIKSKASKRRLFLEYACRHIQGFHFLLAEDLFAATERREKDLLTIEKKLTQYSDCIIIILESESAFAELGAFAVHDELCPIILPVNNKEYLHSPSFIKHGPLEKIDSIKNGLGPTIYANMSSFAHCFSDIQKRLDRIKKNRRERLVFEDFDHFLSFDKKRLLFICDLINILAPVSRKELIIFFKILYGEQRFDVVYFDINILIALSFVSEIDGFLYLKNPTLRFVDFNNQFFKLKSDVILYYRKNIPLRLKILSKAAANVT